MKMTDKEYINSINNLLCPSIPPGEILLSKEQLRMFNILLSEKTIAPHSNTLAWKTPWTEEPGRLQSMGLLRVGHD